MLNEVSQARKMNLTWFQSCAIWNSWSQSSRELSIGQQKSGGKEAAEWEQSELDLGIHTGAVTEKAIVHGSVHCISKRDSIPNVLITNNEKRLRSQMSLPEMPYLITARLYLHQKPRHVP